MSAEIMKFQRDISGGEVLVYNEDRSTFIPLSGSFAKTVYEALNLEPLSKCFAIAEIDGEGQLLVGNIYPDQSW